MMLDKNDPLDRLLEKELRGEPILFDEWEREMDCLADEPSARERLAAAGLTLKEACTEAQNLRSVFLAQLEQHGLSLEDRFTLCHQLAEKAAAEPSDELLHLYCEILSDTGFLMNLDRNGRTQEEDALNWLTISEDTNDLYFQLSRQSLLAQQFRSLLIDAKKAVRQQTDCNTDIKYAIYKAYAELLGSSDDDTLFLENIAQLLQMIAASSSLRVLAPLFLYRMLTKHSKRLHTSDSFRVDPEALWAYQSYQLEQDNGKNYKAACVYLELFAKLCEIYEQDDQVDLSLFRFGFDRLSNLGNFYREQMPEGFVLPLPVTIEDIVNDSAFSCFERGYGDNVILEDAAITPAELTDFESSTDHSRIRALERISDYMNRHAAELTMKFLDIKPEEAKKFCSDILEQAELPARQSPQTVQELTLFCASIYGGMMELVDYYACDFLMRAGRSLIHLRQDA